MEKGDIAADSVCNVHDLHETRTSEHKGPSKRKVSDLVSGTSLCANLTGRLKCRAVASRSIFGGFAEMRRGKFAGMHQSGTLVVVT